MENDIAIHPLRKEHKQAYLDLFNTVIHESFSEYSENIKNYIATGPEYTFDQEIENSSEYYIGAFDKQQLVGVVRGVRIYGGVALCTWLLVNPTYQKKGIGKKLLSNFEDALKKDGIHSVHLYAPERNKQYYLSVGYELIGLWKKAWFGRDDYLFVKLLQEPKEENYLR